MTQDYGIIIGKTQIYQPLIFINKGQIDDIVILAKEESNEIIYMYHFQVKNDFIDEICQVMLNYKNLDYIYVIPNSLKEQFENSLKINEETKTILRRRATF